MNLRAVALLQRLELGLQGRPGIAWRLLKVARPTSTCVTLRARRRQAHPTEEERLVSLRSTEKRIAAVAVGSLVVGYVTLKVAFSDLASKKKEEKSVAAESDSGTKRMESLRPLVLAGPSGSGKSTLLRMLFDEFPEAFGFSVSHTTRNPRAGEQDGREYHFTSRKEMEKSVKEGNFIEWAEFSGNMYGTRSEILVSSGMIWSREVKQAVRDVQLTGKICVLDIDIQGVRSMKRTNLNPLYVFIKPPSVEELEKRLRARKTESEESLQRRLDRAKTEMKDAEDPGVFDHVIVNDDLQRAYQRLRATVTQEMELTKNSSQNTTDPKS